MKLLCECGSFTCRARIEIPDEQLEAVERAHRAGLIHISERCPRGPERSDRLVERRKGYGLYRDTLTNPRPMSKDH